jgi:hypothetical protein
METKSKLSGIFTNSAESARRQLIETPLENLPQTALGPVLEVAALLSALPKAFAESQLSELKRLKEGADENDLRVAYLQASIEQTTGLRRIAGLGEARVKRGVAAIGGKEAIFHGFVSDLDLNPVKGVTVRLVSADGTRSKALSAVTEADGYFKISLGTKRKQEFKRAVGISDRIDRFMSNLASGPPVYTDANEEVEIAEIEIVKKGKVIFRDPVKIASNQGSAYRELSIADEEPASDFEWREADLTQTMEATVADVARQAEMTSTEATGAASKLSRPRAAKKKTSKATKTKK